ncbi:hypothetical protein VE25_03440 [Devosia geojensis]|uniref:Uncharacterized protein n=1 Tax=Devosia geojensis TaxID=443610 RepID=A0A0F5FYA0_9HYPH|nr:hypothetical protein [Devosia geojensis]KKB13147.1 hypothetical protein VE25_03440 [Devosia geojensis]
MTIRGPEALASLEEALRDIRREEDEISKRLARATDIITKMRETEAELFRKLAQVRLDPSVQRELEGRISQSESKAREMLKSHAEALAGTESELAEIDAEINRLTGDRGEALKDVEAHQGELKALSTRIGGVVAKDPAYAQKRAQADELQAIAAQSMRKTEQAEADRDEKGKPYRDDPLFIYLWDRGYGTVNYRANNLIRYLDGLVANLIGFAKTRPNFAMLNEIPLRLREHAERQMQNAAAAEAELDALETAAIDAAGGKPIREALEKAQARIEAIDAEIVAAEDRRDAAAKELSSLAQGGDPAFEQALTTLADALGREDIRTLLAEARRTSTGQDDTLVAQIDEARARGKDEEGDIREQRARLKTLAARRRELEDIQWEFKKARFDDPRSTFREDKLVGDMLTEFLRGGISAASYWDHWRRSQNWSAGTSDWGGGLGLPNRGRASSTPWPPGGGGFQWPDTSFGGGGGKSKSGGGGGFGGGWGSRPTGGGFSRPRTGSTGTRKHGGFKTGGGF